MTEKIFWTPPSPDNEPSIALEARNRRVELRRTNSAVYTYMGSLALFNHVYFLGTDKDKPFYLFKNISINHNVIEEQMLRFGYPHFKDQTWVDEVDIEAYEAYAKAIDRTSIEDIVQQWSDTL
jgi:hypothetical protein